MATQGTDGRPTHGLGAAVKEVAERASAIVRLELELAAMELRRKVVSLGLGIALALAAAIVLLFVVALAGPAHGQGAVPDIRRYESIHRIPGAILYAPAL